VAVALMFGALGMGGGNASDKSARMRPNASRRAPLVWEAYDDSGELVLTLTEPDDGDDLFTVELDSVEGHRHVQLPGATRGSRKARDQKVAQAAQQAMREHGVRGRLDGLWVHPSCQDGTKASTRGIDARGNIVGYGASSPSDPWHKG